MNADMDAKAHMRELLDRLPDNCTLEDVQYHLYVAEKIRRRLEQSNTGLGVPQSEAEKRLEKWLIK